MKVLTNDMHKFLEDYNTAREVAHRETYYEIGDIIEIIVYGDYTEDELFVSEEDYNFLRKVM